MEAKKISSHGRRREIPEDIMFENILRRVPVKSLCRWRRVSKPWQIFIDRTRPKTPPQWMRKPPRTRLRGNNEDVDNLHIFSIDDDEVTSVVQKYPLPPNLLFTKHYQGGIICSYSGDGDTRVVHRHDLPPNLIMVHQNLDGIRSDHHDEATNTIVRHERPHPPNQLVINYFQGSMICSYHESLLLTVFNTITRESTNVSLPIVSGNNNRVFEYGFDPCSQKYKVLTYRYRSSGTNSGAPDHERLYGVSDFEVITLGEDRPTWRSVKTLPEIHTLSERVIVVNGTLFWYNISCAQIISFNLATEEFTVIKHQSSHLYFRRPLFEFEGSLCLVECANFECFEPRHRNGLRRLEFDVWMLKDNSILIPLVKNLTLSLDGTSLQTLIEDPFTISEDLSMASAEFSVRNEKLLIAARDSNKEQYLFSYSFLNFQCERTKIIGQPFQHPAMQRHLDLLSPE